MRPRLYFRLVGADCLKLINVVRFSVSSDSVQLFIILNAPFGANPQTKKNAVKKLCRFIRVCVKFKFLSASCRCYLSHLYIYKRPLKSHLTCRNTSILHYFVKAMVFYITFVKRSLNRLKIVQP